MKAIRTAFALAAALSLGGCLFPMRYYDAPTVHIRVVDARTQAPLAGADVVDLDAGRDAPDALTGTDGAATLDPSTHWTLMFVNWDPIPQPGTLRIAARGYWPKDEVICFYKIKSEPVVAVTVALTPSDAPAPPSPASPGTPASQCY